MNNSPWNSQGVEQDGISGIDRLIYHHSVYSDNILRCLSRGCDFWYQASHCLQHFVETPVTLQACFFQKKPELSWQPLLGTLTYKFFASLQCEKGSLICYWSVYYQCKGSLPLFLWHNVSFICEHKLIQQTNTTHLLVVVLKRIWRWYANLFLGWLWPPLSCSDRITGKIVDGTSSNFVIQQNRKP